MASLVSKRSFPVFSLYSLKAASRIEWNWAENAGVWEDKDMGGSLVRIADWQVCVSESRVKHDRLLIFVWEGDDRLIFLV